MAKYSKSSLRKLRTVHIDLQTLFLYVIKHFDCTIVCGIRTLEEQEALYAKGRTEPGSIITYKDGRVSKSKHQDGLAVDAIPYPTLYSDKEKMIEFGGFVMGIAKLLKDQGIIDNDIEWGGNWEWADLPHFQIKS